MTTAGHLYVLTATVMSLVALAAALPVLRDIALEGRERWRAGEPGPAVSGDEGSDTEGDGVRCRHRGAENESGYTYCEGCSRALRSQ